MKLILLQTVTLALLFFASADVKLQAQQRSSSTNITAPPGSSPALDRMAESMTSMADMCKTMMEKEMKGWPWKMAALALVGTVGVAALVLLVILEVQWIRLLSLRIKAEKAKFG